MKNVIILIELIKFYYYSTNQTFINIKTLEEAFCAYYQIITEDLELEETTPSFDTILKELIETFSNFFEKNKETLFFPDISEINEVIQTFIEYPSYIQIIRDSVFHTKIYKIFDIKADFTTLDPYLEANKRIMNLYSKLAYEEYKNTNQNQTIKELEQAIQEFQNMLINIDLSTLTKIFIAIHQLDLGNGYQLDDSETHSWEIILFSKQPNIWQTLTYYSLDFYGKQIYDNLQDNNSNESVNVFLAGDTLEYVYEPTNFLTLFIIYLNRFLKTTPNFPGKDSLIIKKYLLLSTDDLELVQSYFLKHHSLDNLSLVLDSEKSEEDYIDMLDRTIYATFHLNHKDTEIMKHPEIYAQTIINAIFIRCFLNLSGHQAIKENIILRITTPKDIPPFYKEKEYQIVTDIIDSIIFSESLDRAR